MRIFRLILTLIGALELVLAAGFFVQAGWAMALWPISDTPMSYAFIAAILAGSAAPLIWIATSCELGALAGYGLSFGVMYAGMAAVALWIFASAGGVAFLRFGIVMAALAIGCLALPLRFRRPLIQDRPTPRVVRYSFAVEVLVLAGAGLLLVLRVPNTLPWRLSEASSMLYGWVFLGLALYYLLAVVNGQWGQALGPLLGFLIYDLVLCAPLFARYTGLPPEHRLGQVAASAIIVYSAALGLYYLFVEPSTRIWPVRMARKHPVAA